MVHAFCAILVTHQLNNDLPRTIGNQRLSYRSKVRNSVSRYTPQQWRSNFMQQITMQKNILIRATLEDRKGSEARLRNNNDTRAKAKL